MKELIGQLVGYDKREFKDKNTGEVKNMLLVEYLVKISETDTSLISQTYTSYIDFKFLEQIKKFANVPRQKFVVKETPSQKGIDYKLQGINDIKFRD